MTTPTTEPTEPQFDAHEIAADPDARAAALAAATVAGAILGAAGSADDGAGGSTSQPPRPTAQQRADEQIARRFGAGRTQPVDGRPPRARTGQAAKQLARRFPSASEQSRP